MPRRGLLTVERVYVRAWRDRRIGIVLDTLNDDSEIIPTFIVLVMVIRAAEPSRSGLARDPATGELLVVSLFAGVGGIDLACEQAGMRMVAAVEIDPAAQGVLVDHWPGVVMFNDVTEVTGDQLRAAGFDPDRGLVAAGWPCQGNSVAGRRGGMDDPRSGLWLHVARLLAELHPRWFLGENVPGLLSVNDGRDIAIVRRDLAQLGYWWAERILDAQHFGVPQRRRRIFIVGCLGNRTAPVQVLLEPEGGGRDSAAGGPPGQETTDGASVATLQSGGQRGYRIDAEAAAGGHLVPIVADALPSAGGNDKQDPTTMTYVSFDAAQITHPENRVNPKDGDPAPTLAAYGQPMVASTLRSHPRPGSNSDGAMVMHAQGCRECLNYDPPLVAFAWQAGGKNDASGAFSHDGGTPTLPRSQTLAVADAAALRRLTPLECERLQGYPDGWTLTSRGAPQSDAQRYRQLGNSVAVPCARWIAERIVSMP